MRSLVLLALLVSTLPAGVADPPRVRVTVSVDWEGSDLLEANLVAMERLRAALPGVPLTHFLNPAYFTKDGADATQVTAAIRRTLRPGDETGVHIHAWRSLVLASGVAFRTGPTFWGRDVGARGEPGHDVELEAYDTAELRKIVAKSRAILGDAGFAVSGSFRAGGWIAGPKVLEAIRAEGFRIDSSATDARWHDEIDEFPLRRRIREVWPEVNAETAPFAITTAAGVVVEMPDTCALADYVTAKEMAAHLLAATRRLGDRDLFVQIGFHQESAAAFAPRIVDAIRALRTMVELETLERAADRTGLVAK